MYATFDLEDLDGSIEVMAFPNCYQQYSEVLADDAFVLIKAKVEKNDDDSLKMFADTVRVLDMNAGGVAGPGGVDHDRVAGDRGRDGGPEGRTGTPQGPQAGPLAGRRQTSTKVWALAPEYLVDVSPGFIGDMKVLFGSTCFTGPTA